MLSDEVSEASSSNWSSAGSGMRVSFKPTKGTKESGQTMKGHVVLVSAVSCAGRMVRIVVQRTDLDLFFGLVPLLWRFGLVLPTPTC